MELFQGQKHLSQTAALGGTARISDFRNELTGALLTLGGGVGWGISGSCAQFLFTQKGATSAFLVPIRLFSAGIILLLFYFLKDPKAALAPWRTGRRNALDLLIYALLGVTLCQFTYFVTIQLSSAGVGTIMQDLSPAMILLVTCFLERRRPRGVEVFCLVLALAGVFLLVTHGQPGTLAISPAALLTGLISAAAVTLYNIQPKRLMSQFASPLLLGWCFFLGGLVLALFFRPWTYSWRPDLPALLAVAATIVVGNLLAFNLYMAGVKRIGPAKACLYGCSEPVSAAIISCIWLGSSFSFYDALGFGCILLMVSLLGRGAQNPN